MQPIFHLFPIADSLQYPGAGKKSSRANALPPQRFLRIPGCAHPVSMRMTAGLFELARATHSWHLLIAHGYTSLWRCFAVLKWQSAGSRGRPEVMKPAGSSKRMLTRM